MKRIAVATAFAAFAWYGAGALAQSGMSGMPGMPDKSMGMKQDSNMSMGMGIDRREGASAHKPGPHTARARVKKRDAKAGTVTLAHEPVKSLNWPSMTMGFKVRDHALLDKLAEGASVEVDFVQSGKDFVIIAVK